MPSGHVIKITALSADACGINLRTFQHVRHYDKDRARGWDTSYLTIAPANGEDISTLVANLANLHEECLKSENPVPLSDFLVLHSKALGVQASGYRGVAHNRGRWVARLQLDKLNLFLGRFDNEDMAARACEPP